MRRGRPFTPRSPATRLASLPAGLASLQTQAEARRLTKAARGLLYGVFAYMLWGLFPLFWPLLEPASPLEILACRIVFSLVVVALLLAVRRQLRGQRRLDRWTLTCLCIAGTAVVVNW